MVLFLPAPCCRFSGLPIYHSDKWPILSDISWYQVVQNSGNMIATNDVTHNSTCWLGLDGQYKQPFDTFHNPYPSIVKWWVMTGHSSFCFRSKVFCDVTCCVMLLADSSLIIAILPYTKWEEQLFYIHLIYILAFII